MDTSIIPKANLTICPYDHRVQSSFFFKETSLCDRDNYRKSQPIKIQSINFFVKAMWSSKHTIYVGMVHIPVIHWDAVHQTSEAEAGELWVQDQTGHIVSPYWDAVRGGGREICSLDIWSQVCVWKLFPERIELTPCPFCLSFRSMNVRNS